MSHFYDENDPNYNFKGWRFYFNSYTLRGRFNVSYVFIAVKLYSYNISLCDTVSRMANYLPGDPGK